MRYFRRNRFLLIFLTLLVFCSVMVIRQFRANQARHVELREAFILLYTKGYKRESERIYQRLLKEIDHLPNQRLMDDFQRTLLLVDPTSEQPENLIWKYHWTVSNELEKRSESTLMRALKLAKEK
ncbi:MAG: hypothetical protein M3Y82_09815 [Verrucomicrobiota bacterium]|nr:hypothetical protein [Verrucomicrobiota bacterium]